MFFYILVSSLSSGIIYYKRAFFKDLLISGLWNVTRKYHEYSIYLEEIYENSNTNIERRKMNNETGETSETCETEEMKEMKEMGNPMLILQYNTLTGSEDIRTLDNYYDLEGNLIMLIKNDFYKRLEKENIKENEKENIKENEKENIKEKENELPFNTFNTFKSFNTFKNIFITVEITVAKNNIDITKNMKYFYVEGNKLLDLFFLQWFMKKYYDFELKDQSYYINIIDNNVNMLKLKKNQYILIKNNNTYSIETE